MAKTLAESLNLQGMTDPERTWLGVGEGSPSLSIDVLSPNLQSVAGVAEELWARRRRIGVEAVAAGGIAGLTAATIGVGKVLGAEAPPEIPQVDPMYTAVIAYAIAREPVSTALGGMLRIVDKRRGEMEQFATQMKFFETQIENLGGEGNPEAARLVAQLKYFRQQEAIYTVRRLTSIFSGEALREGAEGAMVALIRMGSPFVAIGLYELYRYMDAVGKNPNFNITGNPQIDAAAKLAIPVFAGAVGLGYGALWAAAEKRFWDIQAPGGGAGKAEEARMKREDAAAKRVQQLAETKAKKAEAAQKTAPKPQAAPQGQGKGVGGVLNLVGGAKRIPGTNKRVQ